MVKYYLFAGKGGVGKTTMASSLALLLSENSKVLLISTDPAHSLSDIFETEIGGKETEVDENLFAIEISPEDAYREYKRIVSSANLNLPMDLNFDLTLEDFEAPGVDEATAFMKFVDLINNANYDYIVFDTAPTGHTLRFLSLPDILDSWLGKMIKLRLKLESIFATFKALIPFMKKEDEKDKSLELLEELRKKVENCKEVLRDDKKTKVNIVMIPEDLSIFESERAIKQLAKYGIKVSSIIVNKVQPQCSCNFCQARINMQKEKMRVIRSKFSNMKIIEVPFFEREVKGREMLWKVANYLQELC